MKRGIAFALSALLLMGGMTGCGHEHEWQDATCTTPKTCATCGETEGEALGHTWEDATCTDPKTCATCGETEGEALGHKWTAATCTKAKTCSVCGETTGSANGHKWVAATYDNPKTCSVCGATEGSKLSYAKMSDYFENTCHYNFIDTNVAGGLQYIWYLKYTGSKEIKYWTIKFNMYDSVGEAAYDEITNKSYFSQKIAGPIESGEYIYSWSDSDPVAYCDYVDAINVDTIKLEFTDGTTVTCKPNYSNMEINRAVDDMSSVYRGMDSDFQTFIRNHSS